MGTFITVSIMLIGLMILIGLLRKKPNIEGVVDYRAEGSINDRNRVLDVHFHYQSEIEIYYKDRDSSQGSLEKAITACEQQIAISREVASAWKKEYKDSLPRHKGFEQLAIIREKQNNYEEAIRVCEQAMKQGWDGDWKKRIQRCRKRMAKSLTKCSS
ncbi:MAG TPA: hypothetical protein DCZ94_21100 [Lentisphaeria bacterium]|nr:MAG: hypothetical protein A2X48_16665 [Lentisphaerae bacterium GWF2_49_21]HBC89443.1 hypothetical protein [Lentisphaeria bacterium]